MYIVATKKGDIVFVVKISLCLIVRDEEDSIGNCLESVRNIVDEIVIVDTGSKDKTKEIARNYTEKVYDFEWIDDFSKARNYSFSKATMDYILWLDADDVLLAEDARKLKKLKETMETNIDIVMLEYNVGYDENGKTSMSFFRERIFRRTGEFKWHDPIHEYIELEGNIVYVNICVTHKKCHFSPGRNLMIFEKMISEGKALSPRNNFYYARELFYYNKIDEAIDYFQRFLNSEEGWSENNISACEDLAKCYGVKKDTKNMVKTLYRSFEYGVPRAEICCQLGNYYKELADLEKAIFWFDLATKLKKPQYCSGFISHDCWGYIPYMEMCVCYDKLGNIEEAIRCNELAGEIKPNDSSVLYNKDYFKSL